MADENTLKRRWAKEDETAVTNAIDALLKHREGRKFLWWLLQVGGVGTQPYASNALQTSFNCGVMNVGNQVLDAIINTAPEGYIAMMKESQNERTTRDSELDLARSARDSRYRDADPEPGGADNR